MTRDVLMVTLSVDRDDLDQYQRLGRRWLTEFPQIAMPDIWDCIRIGDPTVDAAMTIVPRPGGPIKAVPFDLVRFGQFIGKLSEPVESISYLGESDDSRTLGAKVFWSSERHMMFHGRMSVAADSNCGNVPGLVSFLVDLLDGADPAFGCVSTSFNADMGTELDLALRRTELDSIATSREFLRGYSWLTVIPKELVSRLGGSNALREMPLAAMYPLAAGGAVVLASSTPDEYDDVAMRGLFRALAPVLPPGKPKSLFGYDDVRVVYEDASTV